MAPRRRRRKVVSLSGARARHENLAELARERDIEQRLQALETFVASVWNDPVALLQRLHELAESAGPTAPPGPPIGRETP